MSKIIVSLFLIVGALTSTPSSSLAAPPAKPALAQTQAARSERALVFVLTTGLEDAQTMTSVFRHAEAAAVQRKLREVVILVYGRGIQAFDGRIKARPAGLVAMIEKAQRAGVKVVLCAQAIDKMGIDRKRLDPTPSEVVPNAMTTLVDYVVRDAAVVSY